MKKNFYTSNKIDILEMCTHSQALDRYYTDLVLEKIAAK